MTQLDLLHDYLGAIERRLRWRAVLVGFAALALTALGATVLLVLAANAWAFSPTSVTVARFVLFLSLGLAAALGLALPLLHLNRRRAAARAESHFPEFEERLLTLADRPASSESGPFLELLAADTLQVARRADPRSLVPAPRLLAAGGASVAGIATLVWLVLAGPGYLGHGAALLWAGPPKAGATPFYDIRVSPGDASVRRQAEQLITAQLVGLQATRVRLFARYDSASRWEPVDMQPQPQGIGYEFLFAAVPESLTYYVEAGPVRSREFKLRAVDLPGVKRIRVTYRYPAWMGLREAVEERGGDLRAVEGTDAFLEIETDRPLPAGSLVLDGATEVKLESEGNLSRGRVRIDKDGSYFVAATDQGERIRISADYFIEAQKESPPTVRLARPGRDYKASPIEEVMVAVDAEDDFGLQELNLHYSVNGAPEKLVPLLAKKGARQGAAETLLALEDYKLVPGDVVSLYATARDNRSTSRTDIYFIEAQPFEKEFTQSQQSGGGGGGGEQQDQNRISARQKEIIAATWNQQRDRQAKTRADSAEAARFLSDMQAKLRDQAQSLAKRMQSRELSLQNQEFATFAKEMAAAAEDMGAAAGELKGERWQAALPYEQKALQHLLRAESVFRQIQVAFGRQGGGGGGGGAARDLESLFDLELDTNKNQYETGQSASQPNNQGREVDEALQRLAELARRQQELARQQSRNRQNFQQRWEQEMLRREAEQLQRRMEQMGAQNQSGSPSQSQQAAQGQAGQSGRPSDQRQQPAQMSSLDRRVQQALDRLRQATDDMRRANSSASAGQPNEAEARRAAERLNEARELLSGLRREEASSQLDAIGRRAERLAQSQREHADRVRRAYGAQPTPDAASRQNRQQNEQLAQERQELADEVARLERQMQQAIRELSAAERAGASKLREALGELQQNELGLRLRYSSEWIRRGLGAYAATRDPMISRSLERLRDQVKQAGQSLEGKGADPGAKGIESALDRVERLRRQLEAMTRGRGANQPGERGEQESGRQGQGQRGQGDPQARGGQPGEQGQPGGAGRASQPGARGDQPGSEGGPGRNQGGLGGPREARSGGERGEADYWAMNRGGYRPELGRAPEPGASGSIAGIERAYRESVRDLSELRRDLQGAPEVSRDVEELIREMQRLDPSRFPGNPELVERLRSQVLSGLEQIELQLRRKLDDEQSQARSSPSRPIPPGYQNSVAEYFRRLSRGK